LIEQNGISTSLRANGITLTLIVTHQFEGSYASAVVGYLSDVLGSLQIAQLVVSPALLLLGAALAALAPNSIEHDTNATEQRCAPSAALRIHQSGGFRCMSWSADVYTLVRGHSITIKYWWADGEAHGVQLARPMPLLLALDERTGSDFGFNDCRLIASGDGISRHDTHYVKYQVTVTNDAPLSYEPGQLFQLIGGGVI